MAIFLAHKVEGTDGLIYRNFLLLTPMLCEEKKKKSNRMTQNKKKTKPISSFIRYIYLNILCPSKIYGGISMLSWGY